MVDVRNNGGVKWEISGCYVGDRQTVRVIDGVIIGGGDW